jgi:hypothetical protein
MHNWYDNKRVKIKTFINGEKTGDKNNMLFLSAELDWKRLLRSELTS